MEHHECIRRYEFEGSRYLEIVKWLKHQKIDHPSTSRLPPFSGKLAGPREASRSLAPDLLPSTLDQDQDQDQLVAPAAPETEKKHIVADATVEAAWSTIAKAADHFESEFEDHFWPIWPQKVSKKPAKKAFVKIRKDGIPLAVIIKGVKAYIATKPHSQKWKYPAGWLNDERWTDDPAPEPLDENLVGIINAGEKWGRELEARRTAMAKATS